MEERSSQAKLFAECLTKVEPELAADILLLNVIASPRAHSIEHGQQSVEAVNRPDSFWWKATHTYTIGAEMMSRAMATLHEMQLDMVHQREVHVLWQQFSSMPKSEDIESFTEDEIVPTTEHMEARPHAVA